MLGQGLGVLLVMVFMKTENRPFWVRTPKIMIMWNSSPKDQAILS